MPDASLAGRAAADRRLAVWLSTPNVAAAEIARDLGYGAAVLDVEHGTFDLAVLDRYVPFLHALGLEVIAKVLAPERGPIQQALDFGADAVVIPHIAGLAHARAVTAYAKFPPLGDRSFAGGRTAAYGGFDDAWVQRQDDTTRCYPMVEDAGALAEVADILALPTVDGLFLGPSDLSLRRERGAYRHTDADFADFAAIAAAAAAANKPWIFPAWNTAEKRFALDHGAAQIVATMEFTALGAGLRATMNEMRQLALASSVV